MQILLKTKETCLFWFYINLRLVVCCHVGQGQRHYIQNVLWSCLQLARYKGFTQCIVKGIYPLSYHHPNSITRSQNTKHIFPSFINAFLCYTMLDPVLLKSTNVRSRIWIKTFNISIDTAISFIIYHKEAFCFYYTPTILC